jgi:tetratricopeptide (TPR) repeat protein
MINRLKTNLGNGRKRGWAGLCLVVALLAGPGAVESRAQGVETLEAALAIEEPAARIRALKRFLEPGGTAEQSQTAGEATVASWAQLAEKSLAANHIETATSDFRQGLALLPAVVTDRFFADTVIRIPQATSMRGYRREAIELARLLEKRFGGEAQRLAAIGEYFMTVEAPLDAIRVLETAAGLKADDLEIRRRLAQAYRLGLRLDEAIREYQYVIGQQVDRPGGRDQRAFYELGNLYRARGAYGDAIALYEAQLAIEPRHLPSHKGLALAWLASGNTVRYQTAVDKVRELGEAIDDPAQDIYLQTQVALINLSRGRLAAARQAAEAALAIEPRYAWARIAAAEVDLAEGRYFEAERNLLAAQQYANFPTLAFTLGKLYLVVEDFDGALEQLTKVITPSAEGTFQTRLGGTLGIEAETIRELLEPEHQAALFLAEPPTTDSIFQIAESLLRINSMLTSGREMAGRRGLDRLVDLFLKAEANRQVFRGLYLAQRLAGSVDSAMKAIELTDLVFERAEEATAADGSLRDYPNYDREGRLRVVRGRAWDLRGWAFYQLGRPKEAEKALLESIREYGPLPEVRRALWHLGTVRETAGAVEEALALYLAAYDPPAQGDRDLNRTVIELLYRKVHGSLDGLAEQLRRRPADAPIDISEDLARLFGGLAPPAARGPGTPVAPAPPVAPVPRPAADGGEKVINRRPGSVPINLSARLTLPSTDPMFARPAIPAPVTATQPAPERTPTMTPPPAPRVPVKLPSLPITMAITDPLTPFFNQEKYYSRWASFRLPAASDTPPPPGQK